MNELLTDGTGTYTPDATANGWKAYKANEADAFPLADSLSSYAASTPPTGRAMISQLGDDTFTTGGFLVPASLTSETTIGPFSISLFEAYVQPNNNTYSSLVSFASAYNSLACMRIKLDTCWIYNGGSNPSFSLTADGQAYSAWRHLGGVWDAVPYGYLNGEARYLNQKNWDVSKTLVNGIGLGTLTGHTETQQGYMDEVRIRNAASSADWMAAEYATGYNLYLFALNKDGVASWPSNGRLYSLKIWDLDADGARADLLADFRPAAKAAAEAAAEEPSFGAGGFVQV